MRIICAKISISLLLSVVASSVVASEIDATLTLAQIENNNGLRELNALMVRSARLERNLRSLPSQPSVMRAGTAATISELEDSIAAIDSRLNYSGNSLSTEQAEIYWRERVRLMDSLLQLRYAQAQRVSF